MSAERRRAVVIGGGVVGCAVLFELTRRGIRALLLEAAADIGEGASKANSAIVHTGFDSRPGTLESRCLRAAAGRWPEIVDTLGVPFLPVGALMIARSPEEGGRLERDIAVTATALGVRTMLVDRSGLRDIAPFVTDEAVAALSIPDEAVVDPFWLTRAYAEAALAGGSEVRTGRRVVALRPVTRGLEIGLDDGSKLVAEQTFDCAGLHADEIAGLLGDRSFAITPRKGQFLVSEETRGVDRIVLPIPGPRGKGVLVTPIVFGGLLLGPTAIDQEDKDDRATDAATCREIVEACRALVPGVAEMTPIRSFAGLRTASSTGDYVIRPSEIDDRLFLVAGMRSTGISGSPAIADLAVRHAAAIRGWRLRSRPAVIAPIVLPECRPAEVVCLCRSISRGEIESACQRPTAPATLDAVKRRSGATFGDCQGNLCAVAVTEVIADMRGTVPEAIRKGGPGSWMFSRLRPSGAVIADTGLRLPRTTDVIVVGGGPAGVGVSLAVASSDASTMLFERRPTLLPSALRWSGAEVARFRALDAAPAGLAVAVGTTVVGLLETADGWLVLAQDAAGPVESRARHVVLATGGYIEPWEHRPMTGPRPAGVVTADLVAEADRAGLCVGGRAVVIGRGRTADRAIETLESGGTRIVERLDAGGLAEIRGEGRLESVRIGDRWIACDTLVLADRLLPATMLLRALGLVDGRPGMRAPIDADGRLAMPGLWATGTCVRPDVDHATSLADGLALGGRLAASIRGAGTRR